MRQPDGTLREGSCEERDRMNYLFFQKEDQSYRLPRVLEDEHLQVGLCSIVKEDTVKPAYNRQNPQNSPHQKI